MTTIDESIATRLGYKWRDGEDTIIGGIGNATMPAKIINVPSLIADKPSMETFMPKMHRFGIWSMNSKI